MIPSTDAFNLVIVSLVVSKRFHKLLTSSSSWVFSAERKNQTSQWLKISYTFGKKEKNSHCILFIVSTFSVEHLKAFKNYNLKNSCKQFTKWLRRFNHLDQAAPRCIVVPC